MRVLLDTNVLLWALAQAHRLDEGTCATIENGANEVMFSVASIWEIAIKAGPGRTDFAVKPARSPARPSTSGLSNERSDRMPRLSSRNCRFISAIHSTAFLSRRAMVEPATLYTADDRLARYSELVTPVAAR